jgi:hypothetical protein
MIEQDTQSFGTNKIFYYFEATKNLIALRAKLFTFLFGVFSICLLSGQGVNFELRGGLLFPQYGEYTNVTQDTFNHVRTTFFGGDTTSVRYMIAGAFSSERQYYGKTGYELNGLFTIPLSGRLALKTGIGFNYFSFYADQQFSFSYGDTISIDTLASPDFPFIGGIGGCDCYENTIDDLGPIDDKERFQHINMMIPVGLDFEIVPHRLGIHVGGYVQFPLFASYKQESISVSSYESEEMTKCRFFKNEYSNTSGDGIRHVQAGVDAGIRWSLFDRLSLNVGVRKLVTNVFVAPENQNSSDYPNVYKPFSFSAGVSYRFGSSAPPELIN